MATKRRQNRPTRRACRIRIRSLAMGDMFYTLGYRFAWECDCGRGAGCDYTRTDALRAGERHMRSKR